MFRLYQHSKTISSSNNYNHRKINPNLMVGPTRVDDVDDHNVVLNLPSDKVQARFWAQFITNVNQF